MQQNRFYRMFVLIGHCLLWQATYHTNIIGWLLRSNSRTRHQYDAYETTERDEEQQLFDDQFFQLIWENTCRQGNCDKLQGDNDLQLCNKHYAKFARSTHDWCLQCYNPRPVCICAPRLRDGNDRTGFFWGTFRRPEDEYE